MVVYEDNKPECCNECRFYGIYQGKNGYDWTCLVDGKTRDFVDSLREPKDCPLKEIGHCVDCTEFMEWLIDAVTNEYKWQSYQDVYGEIICRKLESLGLLKEVDGYYCKIVQNPVDAVPVIRCKDCKYWNRQCSHGMDMSTCKRTIGYFEANDYCSRAERKEE